MESLRSNFVVHDGQLELNVNCDEFVKGKENDWKSVVYDKADSFMNQIKKNVQPDAKHVLTDDIFSHSTSIEKIAIGMTVMDICKNYFTYKCSTRCGFPKITLDGTVEDWKNLLCKIKELLALCTPEFSKTWSTALLPVLERIVQTRETGHVDETFWNSFCKRGGIQGSGGYTWYNGWINVFFPFIQSKDAETCGEHDFNNQKASRRGSEVLQMIAEKQNKNRR